MFYWLEMSGLTMKFTKSLLVIGALLGVVHESCSKNK